MSGIKQIRSNRNREKEKEREPKQERRGKTEKERGGGIASCLHIGSLLHGNVLMSVPLLLEPSLSDSISKGDPREEGKPPGQEIHF